MNLIDRVAHTNRLAGRSAVEKCVFALGMLLLALVLPSLPSAAVIFVIMLIATLLVARVPLGSYVKLFTVPLAFLVVGVLPLLFSLQLSGGLRLAPAPGGTELALRVVLRSLAAVSCLFFLSLTTPVPRILRVLRSLRTPTALTEVALLIYRYIWVSVETVSSIRTAQSSRLGYRTLRTSYHSLAMLCGSFFGQTLQRARAMDAGLQARNWQGDLRVLDDEAAATFGGLALVVTVQVATLGVALAWWLL